MVSFISYGKMHIYDGWKRIINKEMINTKILRKEIPK
jgi:hypothetical protein